MADIGMKLTFDGKRRFEIEEENGKSHIYIRGYGTNVGFLSGLSDEEVAAIGMLIDDYLKHKVATVITL